MSIVVTAFVIQVSIAIVAFALREKVGQSVNPYLLKYYSWITVWITRHKTNCKFLAVANTRLFESAGPCSVPCCAKTTVELT